MTAVKAGTQDTLMMQQWREMKAQQPNALLLYRCGDFYEMFYEDAEVGSRVLGLTLTARHNGGAADVPLAGVPARALNEYVRRLVRQGFRVAICDQVEDARLAKGIVRRAVVETVTPGVAYSDELLDGRRNNYVVAVCAGGGGRPAAGGASDVVSDIVGVAAADVSTGEFRLFLVAEGEVDALLTRLSPREILVPDSAAIRPEGTRPQPAALLTTREPWEFDPTRAREDLARQFRVHSLEGLGVGEGDAPAVGAAGALLRYLRELQPAGLPHLARPVVERPGGVMLLDEMTCRNLELVESLRGPGASGQGQTAEATLLAVLDRTTTPMGARLLRRWLLAPLADRAAIDARLDAVAALVADPIARESLRVALDGVRDVERLAGKAAAGRATPRELGGLGASLGRLPRVEEILRRVAEPVRAPRTAPGALTEVLARWDSCAEITARIAATLVPDAPAVIGEEPAIAPGVDPELDELRALRDGGRDAIARIQREERERTGIQSLRVGFNRVFGYYIEISNANKHLVPADYQRRQTLSNGERYVTPALKEYEERVLTAGERIEARERELFETLRAAVGAEIARLQGAARAAAELDVYAALAEAAAREGYVRPELSDDFALEITAGRHPVVERMMPRDKFIPNDVRLAADARMIILTGPNMAGKSTVLRQVGLIVLMAQTGSFVPAASARVGVVDRVFTRVGASDSLARGQSTFMVEMAETSAILHVATARSLVLLDEIGRGTSTYDGVSIAWAVSEHLHDRVGCKTIFATHYHELTQLADELDAVRNFNVAVRETGGQVLFLHRVEPGGADRSYGIEVGRLAGLPEGVIGRAREVLRILEAEQLVRVPSSEIDAPSRRPPLRTRSPELGTADEQLALFAAPPPHPAVERLKTLDPNTMTPIEALSALAGLVDEVRRTTA
ncbi:MAG: DNA mismatch repair protein MutS [Gemmatimonadota bacterium]|nr:DNA mismatch repair protein MutS [Gemmatimonadota bacterium]